MCGHYGSRIMGIFSGSLNEASGSIIDILWWYRAFFMEDCAPSTFIGNWALVAPYLCVRFHIFDRPILEEYVLQIEGGPHMFQSCLHATQDGLPHVARVMHPSFESLIVTGTPGLHASLMDIHQDTSFRFILEDDSISSTFKACICSCSSKGAGLWLLVKPSIYLFCIPTIYFHLNIVFLFRFDSTLGI